MEGLDFLITEAESIYDICRTEENKCSMAFLEELCDYIEKMVIKEDEIEVVQGEASYDPKSVIN